MQIIDVHTAQKSTMAVNPAETEKLEQNVVIVEYFALIYRILQTVHHPLCFRQFLLAVLLF
jgi:hypothetical protein